MILALFSIAHFQSSPYCLPFLSFFFFFFFENNITYFFIIRKNKGNNFYLNIKILFLFFKKCSIQTKHLKMFFRAFSRTQLITRNNLFPWKFFLIKIILLWNKCNLNHKLIFILFFKCSIQTKHLKMFFSAFSRMQLINRKQFVSLKIFFNQNHFTVK